MKSLIRLCALAAAVAGSMSAAPAQSNPPQITLYSHDKYSGPSYQTSLPTYNLRTIFAQVPLTFIVQSGTWELCVQPSFQGHCITVKKGLYPANYLNGFIKTVQSLKPVKK